MMLLALDQASRVTGWALFEGDKLKAEGKFSLSPSLAIGDRLAEFYNNLSRLFGNHNFDELAFEDIQLQAGNVKTYKMLAMIQAMAILWCTTHGIKYYILSPSHWRKILKEQYSVEWGRKREEQKQSAMNFIKQKYNLDVSSDEADAICLGTAHILEYQRSAGAF